MKRFMDAGPFAVPEGFKTIKQVEPGLLSRAGNSISGISTGFDDVDHVTGGFAAGDFVLIAARPGMGKTSLCLQICSHIALAVNRTVAVFGYTQGAETLFSRIVQAQEKIEANSLREALPEALDRMKRGINKLESVPIFIDAPCQKNMTELFESCQNLRIDLSDLGVIVVDDLQGMLQQEQEDIDGKELSRLLKELAVETETCVIAASSLVESVDRRSDKRPGLRDVRTCGRLDYAADYVCGIYREFYYNPGANRNAAELIFLKNPNAGYTTIELEFDGACARFDSKRFRSSA